MPKLADQCAQGVQPRRILYFTPDPRRLDSFCECVAAIPSCNIETGSDQLQVRVGDSSFLLSPAHTPAAAATLLESLYVSLLIIDLRCATCDRDHVDEWSRQALSLVDTLDQTYDVEERYNFHRIMVLLGDNEPDRIDRLLVELAGRGVTHFMRERNPGAASSPESVDFTAKLLAESLALIDSRRPGKRALCAAGGGITGIYFELGALKCLDDCLGGDAINNFDMNFGISAGAVVTSLLTAGYSIDELMAALAGVDTRRLKALDLRLLKLSHVDIGDMRDRLRRAAGTAWRGLGELARGRARPSFDSLVFDYADLVGAPFSSDAFEKMLRELLTTAGRGNDFRALGRELYIGATDQDARKHVIFGAEGHRHIPISVAVQASLSVNPAFASVLVEGRYYEDGAVTRTANFIEAINRGANLVFVIDPFVPYVAKNVGMARRRGLLYNIDQNIRTVSFTRLEHARNSVLRRNPEVSSYTFLPSNSIRRLLSVNPMDHRPFLPIWQGAYLSTLRRVKHVCHRMRGDLAAHNISLDTERAEIVAAQLRATERAELADFFPQRKIELKVVGTDQPEAR